MYHMAEGLKEEGNELIRKNKASSAVHRYSKALEWAQSIPGNERQVATLLSNRYALSVFLSAERIELTSIESWMIKTIVITLCTL